MPESPWSRRPPPARPVDNHPNSSQHTKGTPTQIPPVPPANKSGPQRVSPPTVSAMPQTPLRLAGADTTPRLQQMRSRKLLVSAIVAPIALTLASVQFFSSDQQPSNVSTPSATSIVVQTSAPVSVIDTRPPPIPRADQPNWELLARSVVFIEALSPCDWRGSGTIVLDGSFVLTNEHVASSGECPLRIGLTTSLSSVPTGSYEAVVLVADAEIDLAVLRIVDDFGDPLKVPGHDAVEIDYGQPPLGSQLATLGYPALGSYDAGMTITFTSGTFSGIDYSDGEFFKTDAQMRGGVSGGAAFNERGLLVGIPTAGLIEEDTNEPVGINLIRPVRFAKPLLEAAKATSA